MTRDELRKKGSHAAFNELFSAYHSSEHMPTAELSNRIADAVLRVALKAAADRCAKFENAFMAGEIRALIPEDAP